MLNTNDLILGDVFSFFPEPGVFNAWMVISVTKDASFKCTVVLHAGEGGVQAVTL